MAHSGTLIRESLAESICPDLGRFESQEPILKETGAHNQETVVHGRNLPGREDENRWRENTARPLDPT